jgi:class 3 adenylate cyclase/pimeloyl-ACP methyl ester carboxylesterase
VARTVRYAVNDDVHIAYQVLGEGPIDLVYTPGIWSNLEVMWEWPAWSAYLERLASFSRLILFDMRGIGLSDRGSAPPIVESQADDLRAVMDAARSESAAIFGGARGAAMTMLFAATYPERVRALVLYAPVAKTVRSDDWPYGRTAAEQRDFYERFVDEMGTGENLDLQGPSHDERFKGWWAHFERLVATPGAYRELARIFTGLDVRGVLPLIQAPTLVLHRTGDRVVQVGQSRAVAERILDARFVELPGVDHIPFLGDWESVAGEIEEFLTGARSASQQERSLATVLFTDIVGSTARLAELGDRRWRELVELHHSVVRRELARFGGREVDTAGDGFFATFDGPARAIRCTEAIRGAVRSLGLEPRAGIHTGECEVIDGKVGGLAVVIGARVGAMAAPSEVLVSQTVKDLVAGSGIAFEDAGEHELKGVPDRWRLYRVTG